MIGRLIDSWKYTWSEIWAPLGKVSRVPRDLYIQLYQSALLHHKTKLEYEDYQAPEMVERLNNPEAAIKAFKQFKNKDFKGESAIVGFFVEVHNLIEEIEHPELAERYFRLVEAFFVTHNLRYKLDRPFHLTVQLPWVFVDIYGELNRINQRNPHLSELMNDFEEAFDTFLCTRNRRDFKTSISKASNYAEGIAAVNLKVEKGSTLGQMADELVKVHTWPHAGVKKALQELYNFCSDYPGIRHAGNRDGSLRPLKAKDTVLICVLLLGFSGYMHNQVNFDALLE